jgi:cytochrome c oxidase subunit 1/cytochrome c oxidase subunit I+III
MSDIPYVPAVPSLPSSIEESSGMLGWVATVDHKRIGIMYLVVSLFFFGVGGIEALLIRLQLAHPNNNFLSPSAFDQIFTMHGTTMIFLVAMPVLTGMANYIVPLMIGAKDVALPRLNALSLWLLVFGGLFLYFSFIAGGAPAAGWFSYAPLSERAFSSSTGLDYYALGLFALGIGSIAAAINLIVTIAIFRAPGLTIRRLPLFVWMVLVTQVLVLLALPALNASLAMLLIDRLLHAHFFLADSGGSALLWQHFFGLSAIRRCIS